MKHLTFAMTLLAFCPIARADGPKPFPGQAGRWEGFARHDFQVDGAGVIVVEPATPLPGRPWAWRGEFFGAFPNADIALLKAGWHLAYLGVPDQFGSPGAVARWEKFYDLLVKDHRLSPKPALIGMSRGALYCMAWAAAHPDRTLLVYLDNGVCDFKSWPGGKPKGLGAGQGSPEEWSKLLKAYDFKGDEEAIASRLNPVDRLAPLAKAKVPILLVYGDNDSVVPHSENSEVIYDRYKALGGPVERIVKPGLGHHPHGLADPAPIVEFFEKHRSQAETAVGWLKSPKAPVLGGNLGTCFDISVFNDGDVYRMWFSWRPKKSIALVESKDGIAWSAPSTVLGPNDRTDWESDINRPVVIKQGGLYRMWYTGQANNRSWIGYATSEDGKAWKRESDKPVLSADRPWEKAAVMCPHVLFDEQTKLYRMWYSGGEQYEPDAIGHATSKDGLAWVKHEGNPVFRPDPALDWERDRVTACQVVRQGDGYLMFYIGFRDRDHAQIGVARSKDGLSGWQRHPSNPIIRPGEGKWDQDAVYKPYAIFDGRDWLLWYNGRRGGVEQIGLATHEGEDLGF